MSQQGGRRMTREEFGATLKPHPDSIGRKNYVSFAPEILSGGISLGDVRVDRSKAKNPRSPKPQDG